jgi:hypothetical protein
MRLGLGFWLFRSGRDQPQPLIPSDGSKLTVHNMGRHAGRCAKLGQRLNPRSLRVVFVCFIDKKYRLSTYLVYFCTNTINFRYQAKRHGGVAHVHIKGEV